MSLVQVIGSGRRRRRPSVPAEAAGAYGYGYYDFSSASGFSEGTGAKVGHLYQWHDQTMQQHIGTLTDRQGATGTTLAPIVTSGGETFLRLRKSQTDKFWLNNMPVAHHWVMILILRNVDAPTNANNFYVTSSYTLALADRPYILPNLGTAIPPISWVLQGSGGGGGDNVQSSEGNNVGATRNVLDGNWHCIAVHWGDQANEGLMFDIDGQPLIPNNSSFTVSNFTAVTSFFALQCSSNGGGNSLATNNHTQEIAAMAWGRDRNTCTHAQTREVAAAMMTKFGITSP